MVPAGEREGDLGRNVVKQEENKTKAIEGRGKSNPGGTGLRGQTALPYRPRIN